MKAQHNQTLRRNQATHTKTTHKQPTALGGATTGREDSSGKTGFGEFLPPWRWASLISEAQAAGPA